MQLFYTDHFELPLPTEHRFPMTKYRLLRERIQAAEWGQKCTLHVPNAATDEELELVHSPAYVRQVVHGTMAEREIRRLGFPWSEELVERSRRSTGATIAASLAAVQSRSIAVNLAGGTHHAFADRGEGYCVFNDVAVAARVLQFQHGTPQILVVDCDVHQGNGTAEIFESDPSVVTFSMHSRKNYPLKKTTSDLDVPLENGTEDAFYHRALDAALTKLLDGKPEFVFYVAGADPFEGDALGRLGMTKEGLRRRDELVFERCREQQIPMAVVMAGGYAPNVADIVDIHANTVRTALEFA